VPCCTDYLSLMASTYGSVSTNRSTKGKGLVDSLVELGVVLLF